MEFLLPLCVFLVALAPLGAAAMFGGGL